ncbi:DUF411 domain-containing protein [Synechocystis sp. LEGE 06083]|uniref:DUF411 domain-containing protein n=1 Tax=Synechocystis sp. LEGE 06083 TaxID=915336 RepID=UPI001D151C8B|nr:DUF411 domain-containing protein [Synechocystis sp. LEGE 06083]
MFGNLSFYPNNNAIALSHENNATVLASVWDQSRESYTGNNKMTVYRSPSCGCCGGWIDHVKKQGFQVTDIKTDEMDVIKQQHQLPQTLASCHTAIINGYVIEGHVPADDIKRFLKQKPQMAGLSVPAMPSGTPGMEMENRKQPFEVLAFNNKGKVEIFKRYEKY